jgi:DNA-directed RNA polymerase subunit RPC12/RpoP
MKKDLPYLRCLSCKRKIYADEIRYRENNTIVICPYCSARNIVKFYKGNGGVLYSEFIKIDEEE